MQHENKIYQIAPSHCNGKESKWIVWTCGMSTVEVHGSLLWMLIWERSEEKNTKFYQKNKELLDSLLDMLSQEFPSSSIWQDSELSHLSFFLIFEIRRK